MKPKQMNPNELKITYEDKYGEMAIAGNITEDQLCEFLEAIRTAVGRRNYRNQEEAKCPTSKPF